MQAGEFSEKKSNLRSPGMFALAQCFLYSWCRATGSEDAGLLPSDGPLRTLMKPGPEFGGRSSKDACTAVGPLLEVGALLAASGGKSTSM